MLLKRNFFARDAREVAKGLLGKKMVRKLNGAHMELTISEVECYFDETDEASHARFGIDSKARPMFGPPGIFYIYQIYGMHFMLNVVTGKEGSAQAVLVRSTVEISGPGRVCKYLGIDKTFNECSVENDELFFAGTKTKILKYETAPRIGINCADTWKEKKLRYVLLNTV